MALYVTPVVICYRHSARGHGKDPKQVSRRRPWRISSSPPDLIDHAPNQPDPSSIDGGHLHPGQNRRRCVRRRRGRDRTPPPTTRAAAGWPRLSSGGAAVVKELALPCSDTSSIQGRTHPNIHHLFFPSAVRCSCSASQGTPNIQHHRRTPVGTTGHDLGQQWHLCLLRRGTPFLVSGSTRGKLVWRAQGSVDVNAQH